MSDMTSPKNTKGHSDVFPVPLSPWPPIVDEGLKCPKCNMIWKGVMGYCCPHSDCPIQPKTTC